MEESTTASIHFSVGALDGVKLGILVVGAIVGKAAGTSVFAAATTGALEGVSNGCDFVWVRDHGFLSRTLHERPARTHLRFPLYRV